MNASSSGIGDVINATEEMVYIENKQNVTELVLYITFEVCIALFAFFNNVLVIIALWKFQTLRTPTNWFVASLAVADIAVAVFAIPSAILLRLGLALNTECEGHVITQPSVGEGMCLFIVSSVIFLTQVSIFSLLIIAIDRFIAITYPFRYGVFMTSSKTRAGIIAAWVLGALIGVAPELGWNKWAGTESNCERQRCAFEDVISMEYMVYFNFFGCVLTPLIIMGVIYTFIFRSAKHQLRKIYFDVKKYKRKIRDSRHETVDHNTKSETSSMNFDLTNSCHNNKNAKKRSFFNFTLPGSNEDKIGKFSSEITSETSIDESSFIELENFGGKKFDLAGNCDTKMHQLEKISEKAGSCDLSLQFPSRVPEKSISNPTILSDATKMAEYRDSNSESAGNSKTLPQIYPKNGVATEISQEFQNEMKSQRNLEEMRKRLHDRSASCEESKNGSLHHELRCKAHSFSASTNTKRHIFNQSRATYNLKVTPLQKLTNGELPSSLNSSRSTIFTSEHGVWSASESGSAHRRMKRKRQLLKKEFKAARSLATVVGLFATCWLPLHILNTLTLFCPGCFQPNWLKDLAILLSHANSLLNPLLYAYKLRDFRSAFRRILAPFFSAKPDPDRTTSIAQSSPGGLSKLCCIVTSGTDVIDEFPSDERTASYDSWKDKGTRKMHTFRPKTSPNKSNSNNNNSTSLLLHHGSVCEDISPQPHSKFSIFNKSKKRTFSDKNTPRNSTEVTLLPRESVDIRSSPIPHHSENGTGSTASSNEDIFMKFETLEGDIEMSLLKSPETNI